jgi:hypothetical protein
VSPAKETPVMVIGMAAPSSAQESVFREIMIGFLE